MKLEDGRMMAFRTFFILFVSVLGTVNASDESIVNVATKVGHELSKSVEDAMNYKYLNGTAKHGLKNKTPERDGENISKQAVDKITTLFNERLLTVKEMAVFAEEQYNNYTINHSLSGEPYDYFNAAENNSNQVKNYGEQFSDKVNVNLSMSVIQTPMDVYQYANKILNSIEWTKKLDEKFKENLRELKTKYKAWQFIGLKDGVYRSYPGSLWYKKELQYYDCRQRRWYIEGSSSPKDIVIVLDMSGSVIGNRLLIVKLAVMSLLDTLQENDFVNIVYFNKEARYVKSDWKLLVQATERNKKILKNAMDPLKGANIAVVQDGFSLAFQILKESKNNTSTTSGCSQIIAFFTDGVEGDTVAEDVFSDYNSEKKIRVFTYLVGREKGSSFKAVRWAACENRGYFYRIETLSDVRANIVKYINVLSRSAIKTPKWTPLYVDALGLGMVSSLVSPIFDTKDGKRGKQLGVVGLDVTLEEIMSKIPEHELGAGGYAFAITNNGFIFFHPRLKEEKDVNLKNPPSVLLSEVERHFDDDEFTDELTKAMIDRTILERSPNKNGHGQHYILAKYNDKFLIVKRKLEYFYRHIINTSFSMAIALTDYGSQYLVPKDIPSILNTKNNLNKKVNYDISAAKWPYCNDTVENWQNLKEQLETTTDWKNCKNKDLMGLLLYDLDAMIGWKPKTTSGNITEVFFGTTSGLTFFARPTINTIFETSIRQEYFERAADYCENKTIVFSAHDKGVRASKAVTVESAVWGVAGVQIMPELFKRILEKLKCSNHENTTCYLVDENGYIIFSEHNDHTGVFFGKVEGLVMKDLINKTIFTKYNFTDVQGICGTGSDDASSSVRILDPLFAFVNYAKWWSKTIALSFIQYSFYSIMTGRSQVNAADDGSEETKSCFKKMDLYIRKDIGGVINGSFVVCEKSYKAHLVQNTNLMLVIVNEQHCPADKNIKLTNDPEEIEYEGPIEPLNKYRKKPDEIGGCVPTPEESEECSGGKSLLASLALVLLLQMAIFLKTGYIILHE